MNDYYKIINVDEYTSDVHNNKVNIGDRDINRMRRILPMNCNFLVSYGALRISKSGDDYETWIYRLEDEYYVVYSPTPCCPKIYNPLNQVNQDYYKCDQWEGLVKLLKTLGIL